MSERILILAPVGRDAIVTRDLLIRQGFEAVAAPDITRLVGELGTGAGAALITEEALSAGDPSPLLAWVRDQPRWSDFPFIILSDAGALQRRSMTSTVLEALGNLVLLERPLHSESLIRALRSALKARRRQYEVREFADTLSRTVADRTRELAEARDSLQIALDAAELGSWDLDLIEDRSRRTLRHDQIFGYRDLQAVWGREVFLHHVVEDDRARVAHEFEQALARGWLDFECRICRVDGVIRCIAAKARVQYLNGDPTRMVGVVADVTARKDADAQLAQIQKMDTIGQLTGGVAHDFNNLLTPIVGSLDLLRRRHPEDERSQKLIGAAQQAAERAATLTQRLLSFARRQALRPQPVDTAALMEGLVELMSRSIGPAVEIKVDAPRRLRAALVDPNQLELALLNLAVNARDAMPTGGRLTLAVNEELLVENNPLDLAPGWYVKLTTVDTGVGMDVATLERAVDPFFSTKGVGKGTGLGLSMVHGLAAQSGGALRIRSRPGEGTTVELWLPATDETPSAGADAPTVGPSQARRSATILLVDDEDVVRRITADMLADLGYKVVQASSGTRALAMLRDGIQADVLVSDYLMPHMTGAILIQEMRESGFSTPALLITGYANVADDVPPDIPRLSKPFRQVDLAARLDELVHRAVFHAEGRPALKLVRDRD